MGFGDVEREGDGRGVYRVQGDRRYHFVGQAIPLGYCAWEK